MASAEPKDHAARALVERIRVKMVAPRTEFLGERFTVRVETRNAVKGQRATIFTRVPSSKTWQKAGRGKLNRRGVFQLRRVYTTGTSVQFRAVVKRGKGRPGGTSKPRTTRLRVWSTSVDAMDIEGTLLRDGEFNGAYYWTPSIGKLYLTDLEEMVAAPDPNEMDALTLGPTGAPEATRIIIASKRLVPADGLTPEGFLQQLHVYNPTTRRIERTIDLGSGLDQYESDPAISFAGGDGNVFAVTIRRGDGEDLTTVGINMLTGQTVWSMAGHRVDGQQEVYGKRGVTTLESTAHTFCDAVTLVVLETGLPVRTVSTSEGGCGTHLYDRGELLHVVQRGNPYPLLFDATTGAQLTSTFTVLGIYATALVYDRAGGLLAGTHHEDGKFEVTRTDGSSVWSLPGAQANALQLKVVRLAENTLWLETTDQHLRVDLATGATTVVVPPEFAVAHIAGGYTLYSTNVLRRDRF